MSSTEKIQYRIKVVFAELRDLSTALDTWDREDREALLRAITANGDDRLLFAHGELLMLVTLLVARWFPDWEPLCTDTPSTYFGSREQSLDLRRLPQGIFSALMGDIQSAYTLIFQQRAVSQRSARALETNFLMFQAQLTRHSAYCMYLRSQALRGREAARVMKEALTNS